MANEPITREEIMLNAVATGEAANLEPITREEMFLAKLGGADVNTPTPITRKEQFLQKAIDNSGGSGGGGTGGGGAGGDSFPIGDGNTHIWISLQEGRTSPMLGVCPNGTVTVDWGDGTEPDVLTGTSTSTVKWTPTHNYASAGDYVITLTVDGKVGILGSSGSEYSGTHLLRDGNSTSLVRTNMAYLRAAKKVEIGNGALLGTAAFNNLYNLTNVHFSGDEPLDFSTSYIFDACHNLKEIEIPDGVTTIGKRCISLCYSLVGIAIPSSVVNIEGNAFTSNFSACYYDFTKHTTVPTLSASSAFSFIPDDCEIRVPAALYDEWVAATNWSTYASKIVAV